MDKTHILAAFNDHFLQFVEDIRTVFPDNTDIVAVILALTTLRKANPRLIMLSFKEHVVSFYRKEIENGDINFFIDNDYKNDLTRVGVKPTNQVLEKIECLKGPIREMDKNDQDKVIKYMQNLTKLSDLYM